jgi:hypothetical protein
MAANVLNSERALEASVLVVRAFVRLRQFLRRGVREEFEPLLKAVIGQAEARFRGGLTAA